MPMTIKNLETQTTRTFNFTIFKERKVIGAFQFRITPEGRYEQKELINQIPYLLRKKTQDFIGLNLLCHKTNQEDRVRKVGNFHSKGSLVIYSWVWEEVS